MSDLKLSALNMALQLGATDAAAAVSNANVFYAFLSGTTEPASTAAASTAAASTAAVPASYTKEQVTAIAGKYAETHGMDAFLAKLTAVGSQNISGIDPSKYGEFVASLV